MQVIFGILYTFLFFSYVSLGLFIAYHLFRFSFSRKVALFSVVFFSSVLGILLFTNAFLFFTMPWEALLPNNSLTPFGV